jgi:heme/copper-type cytochrome/quinol oxidase subunit 3
MTAHRAIDVSPLPTFAFGHRSAMWWGLFGLIAIEGTAFALLAASYLYLRWRVPDWPPGLAPPALFWGTVNLLAFIASLVPNELAKRAAERVDLTGLRLWMVVCIVVAVPLLVMRALEFAFLNCWWDSNAYGSIVWAIIGMHTIHLITDVVDTAVLAVLMFTGPIEGRRFVDASENALYWYFVVLSWIPLYGLIYLSPRVL